MRHLLSLFVVLVAALAVGSSYVEADNSNRDQLQQAVARVAAPFTISDDPTLSDPRLVSAALAEAADATKANVFRSSIGYAADGRQRTIHYALLTRPSSVLRSLPLRAGRPLTPSESADPRFVMSTQGALSDSEVGVIADFGGNDLVDVQPFAKAFDGLPTAGEYEVELAPTSSWERFEERLAAALNHRLRPRAGHLTSDSFRSSVSAAQGTRVTNAALMQAVLWVLIGFSVLLVGYLVAADTKKSGVLRLHGYPGVATWYSLIGRRLVGLSLGILPVVLVVTLLVPQTTTGFVGGSVRNLLAAMGAMALVSAGVTMRASAVPIGEAIKNRKDVRIVFAANTIARVICTVLMISAGAGLWVQYSNASAERARLANWEQTTGYGVFYPVSVGNDLVDTQAGLSGPTAAEVYGLYPRLNAAGALYVDASQFEPDALANPLQPGQFRTLTVNPNYLRQFPIQGADGRPVAVDEATTDWVVLAPVSLRARERQLRAFLTQTRFGPKSGGGLMRAEQAVFGRTPPTTIQHQSIRIVWTAGGQRVFSFDPDVDPDAGSTILDPVVMVVTDHNSLGVDRANAITGAGGGAMKVRLSGADPAATLATLEPVLRQLMLEDNLRDLVSLNQYMLARLQYLDQGIRAVATAGAVLTLALVALAYQSLRLIFDRYARRVVVRRLHGHGFASRYREYLTILAVVWTAQFVGGLAANRMGVSPFATSTTRAIAPDSAVIVFGCAILLAELALSARVLIGIERRGTVEALKGEF